ncbi:MAG: GcrA cell cycle regulator [Rhodospirillales bacterium]|nr:GcrA cell cycle regulator [Rhodospirillales bacterium]
MDWNDEIIQRLRALWDEGHSTAEIGRRLGVSKNAVVGKAHRLDLPARPSPIRREGAPGVAPRRVAPRRPAGPTLPPLSSASAALPAMAAPRPAVAAPQRAPAPAPAPRIQVVAPRPYAREIACCWPIGEPGTPSFRFCDAGAVPGKPYCAEHAAIAYVKVRDRREDAA